MPLTGIVGHGELVARLLAEHERRPAHGYLFIGRRGIGKALSARAFVHALLCERSPGAGFCCSPERCAARTPVRPGREAPVASVGCGCCAGCVQVALGVHPDFVAIGRASGRTDVLIEQVRTLIGRFAAKPVRGPVKCALIDDAETLNVPAQNALLKTLEEPPGQAVIVLVTASEHALLDTVRSRLIPVRFHPLTVSEVEHVLNGSGELEPSRAALLARLARASVGRAMEMADESEPQAWAMLDALKEARRIDFARAYELAQRFFAEREQAVANLELVARLLEEMLCFRILGAKFTTDYAELAQKLTEVAETMDTRTIIGGLEATLAAMRSVDAMANPRLQGERWWMTMGEAARNENERGN